MSKSRFYVHSELVEEYQHKLSQVNPITYQVDYELYKNAIIMPLRRNLNLFKPELNVYIEGGVFSNDLKPLASYQASIKDNPNIYRNEPRVSQHVTSDPISEIKYLEETVIWAGHLVDHYGHFFTDSLSRLWYVLKYSSDQSKIAFIIYKNELKENEKTLEALLPYHIELFELLGISQDRILIVDTPTRFNQIIVPKQSIYWVDAYNDELIKLVYDKIRDTVIPKHNKKIYLSRSKFDDCMFNEEYFERFFARQGFKIVYPEQMSIKEQISYLAGADEIAATVGTLTHQILFAKDGVKMIGLLRTHKSLVRRQAIINKIRNVDYTYVDVSINLFPVPSHWETAFLIGPNYYWNEFLKSEYEIQNKDDITNYLNNNNILLGDYIKTYIKYLLKHKSNLIDYDKKSINDDYFKSLLISFDGDIKDYQKLIEALNTKKINHLEVFNNKAFELKSNTENQGHIILLDQSREIMYFSEKNVQPFQYWIYFDKNLYILNARQECLIKFDLTEQNPNPIHEIVYQGVGVHQQDICYTLKPVEKFYYQNEIKISKIKYYGIKLLLKCLVNKNRYKKFKKNPHRFFNDSKSRFIRFLGRYYEK